jgi:hypothetical protein
MEMTTFLILLLFAVIFLAAGGALLYFRGRTKQKAALMGQTETSDASDISGLAPGTLVEVKGTLRCEEPLVSEMAGERCAYYSSQVVREYLERDYDDEDYHDVGSDRRSEVVAQNVQFAPFTVEDPTGGVPVNAEGAEVDAKQVVNRFERNTGGGGLRSLWGVRPSTSAGASEPWATATPRASWRWTRQSTCLGPYRKSAGSGLRYPVTRDSDSSSATAPRRRWDRAWARPSCGWAREASPRSSWALFCS